MRGSQSGDLRALRGSSDSEEREALYGTVSGGRGKLRSGGRPLIDMW